MSLLLDVVLACVIISIVLRSRAEILRVLRFWVYNSSEEFLDVEAYPHVLTGMLRVVAVNLSFSLSYILALSLIVKLPHVGGGDYLIDLGATSLVGLLLEVAVIEEALFRWLPLAIAWVVHKGFKRDVYWELGLIASLVFGLVHISNYPNPDPSYVFLVVPQIMAGLWYYWFALKYRNGCAIVVYVHFLSNLILLLPSILGLE